ncbi:TPA: hypothetical protein ACMDSJ_002853 [Vibrio parahaemolyticus]|uniref:hypothetical protein n=1 Tax=Vibrio diabolicus TaxID=50719 RepID=UPI001ED5F9AD|nr:hypothetical protein [Vibrio parahaemolyticus]
MHTAIVRWLKGKEELFMALIETAVPRVSDSNLLKVFIDQILLRGDELGITNQAILTIVIQSTPYRVHMSAAGTDDEFNAYIQEGEINHSFLNELKSDNSTNSVISRIHLVDKGVHTHFYFEYLRSANSLVDVVKTQGQQLNSLAVRILTKIDALLHTSSIGNYPENSQFDIASVHHDVLTRLEGLNANLILKQNELLERVETEKKEFVDRQLEEFAEKVSTLDSKHQQRLRQLEDSYNAKNEALDERQKQIDDADNTTARRETTTATLKEVQAKAKRFDFSSAVSVRSWMACFFAIILGIIGGFNSYIATDQLYAAIQDSSSLSQTIANALTVGNSELLQDEIKASLVKQTSGSDKFVWFLYIKIFFSSALLVSSIIYLVKWFNSWADRLAQQELDNQLFVRDLNRAHLAIEMSLEWNEKKDGAIPDRLLQSLTDNLFQSSDSTPKEILHPAEQLASALVRSADKINVPFAGGNLEVSGKKLGKTKSAVNDG